MGKGNGDGRDIEMERSETRRKAREKENNEW